MTQTLKHVPLSALYLHPLNPRKSTSAEDEAAMAESIRTGGLIYNLAGFIDPERPDGIGIVDGGRRFRGLLALEAGHPDLELLKNIPVNATDNLEQATAWAVTGNERLDQEPADEIRAYGRMKAQGMPISTIAAQCAQTENHVQRRLALASLPDQALDALKEGKINLSLAQHLTAARDEAQALQLLEICIREEWTQHQLKRKLEEASVVASDKRVKFVGLKTYQEAGGRLTPDLFTDATYLHDETKLDELVLAKLRRAAEEAQQEGWAFVWHAPHHYVDDSRMKGTEILDPTPAELPEGDKAELEELRALPFWELEDDQQERLESLRERARGDYTEEQRAQSGLFLWLNHEGKLQRTEGVLTSEAVAIAQEDASSNEPQDTQPKKEPPAQLSEVLRTDLARIALRARQTAAMAKPDLLLDLLAYQMSEPRSWGKTLNITLHNPANKPDVLDGLIEDSRLDQEIEPQKMNLDGFLAFQAKGKKHRNTILAQQIACQIDPGASDLDQHLNRLTAVEVRKIWTPTTQNFFGRMRHNHLDPIWNELFAGHDEDRDAAWANMKVKEKAKELGDLFSNAEVQEAYGLSRDQVAAIDAWVPQEMALATKHDTAAAGTAEEMAAE